MNIPIFKKLNTIFHNNQKYLFDSIILFTSIIIVNLMLHYFDASETIYRFIHEHKHYNLDEIILTITCSFFFLFIFNLRRLDDYINMTIKADTDPLLGILNRRKGTELITNELSKLKNRPSSLIMFDLDDFKKINDNFGHDVGDYVLKEIVILLTQTCRRDDELIRWGGEEFVVLSHYHNENETYALAQRFRQTIQDHEFEHVHNVTASFGVIALNQEEDLRVQVVNLDKKLYSSKKNGKNQVTKL